MDCLRQAGIKPRVFLGLRHGLLAPGRDQAESVPGTAPWIACARQGSSPECSWDCARDCARDQAQSVARDCARDQAQSVPGSRQGLRQGVVAWDSLEKRVRKMLRGVQSNSHR
jgi:hypothetical protein